MTEHSANKQSQAYNPVGTWTLFKRETMRFSKVWMQTLAAPVVSNLLYLAIFGISMRRAVTEIQGVPYLEFLVPGLVIMGLINSAFQNPSSSLIIQKFQGIISLLMSIPLRSSELLLAFVSSAIFRALLVGTMTFLVSLFFTSFSYTSLPLVFLTAFLVSTLFGFVGVIIGIWADDFDRIAFLMNFILMPLIFLGGVFYPISSLPPLFQQASAFNPIVHMINLLRYGLTGILEYPIATSLLTLIGLTVFTGTLAYALLRKGWKLQN